MRRTIRLVLLLVMSFAITFALGACDDDDHGVGAYCEFDDECPTGTCYTKNGANYCTATCSTEGSLSQCPEPTICKRIHGGPLRCLLLCERNVDCPPNSECKGVSGSDFRACEPDD